MLFRVIQQIGKRVSKWLIVEDKHTEKHTSRDRIEKKGMVMVMLRVQSKNFGLERPAWVRDF